LTVLQRRLAEPIFLERGPVVCLLLHGFAGSPAEIRPLAEYLAARGITVRAPLLPGHGTDPDDLRHTRWPQWVRAAEAELADLAVRYGQVHVAGFSMGGLVALHVAAHRPVASVSTMACPSRLADWRQVLVPLARHLMPYYPARISRPELAAQMDSYDRFPMDAVHSLLHLAAQVRKDLPRVTVPLLVLQGDRDRWIDPDSAAYIMQNSGSQEKQQVTLPGRGHLITLEHGREEVFQQVSSWINKHASHVS
jgi:carboxylesterase